MSSVNKKKIKGVVCLFFSRLNLFFVGGFGTVYKGTLAQPDGQKVTAIE